MGRLCTDRIYGRYSCIPPFLAGISADSQLQAAEIVAHALITYEVTLGLGKHIWDIDPQTLHKLGIIPHVSDTMGLLSLLFSKTSFGFTMLRLTSNRINMLIWVFITSMAILFLALILVIWLQCTPLAKTWNPTLPGSCIGELVITVCSTVTVSTFTITRCRWMVPQNLNH